MTPTQVVEALHKARTQRRFQEFSDYIAGGEGPAHVRVVLAIEQVLAQNSALQAAAAKKFGRAPVLEYDVSTIGDSYGVLSLNMRVVREWTRDEKTFVTIQEGQTVPLTDVPLVREADGWRVRLDSPEEQLVTKLHKLARTLEQVREEVAKPEATMKSLVTEFRLRVRPQIKSIGEGDGR